MNVKIKDALKAHPLFRKCSTDTVEYIGSDPGCSIERIKRGEMIYGAEIFEKRLGYMLKGTAEVYSADSGRDLLLRYLRPGDLTGVANLFNDSQYVSRITAAKDCEVMFISAELLGRVFERDKNVLYSYINFLSDRICFLNNKIVCLTAGSAERRLSVWLDGMADENNVTTLKSSITSLAEQLNLGRASLYRAFDKLTDDGYISRNGKTIVLCDREKMLERYKGETL